MTTTTDLRGLAIELPDGFIGLPTSGVSPEDVDSVTGALEQLFGVPHGDPSAGETARWLCVTGQTTGLGGMELAAIGFFHSPDDLERPVYALVSSRRMPADFGTRTEAISGLQELFSQQEECFTQAVELDSGQALLVTTERPMTIPTEGREDGVPVLQREVTAWLPDSTGSVLGVISVSSGSWRDWAHVCDLALTVFNSAQWEPLADHATTAETPEGI